MEQKIASLTGKIPENKKQKIRKQLAPYVIGLLLALLPVAFLMLRNPEQVEAGWYNDNWTYRQKIVFGNSGSAVTNQKVLIEIDTATLISSGYMQSDCGDVRFTNAGGKILSHYLDSGAGACNTASTDYYVLFEDIVAGDNLSYIYYGNPNAQDAGEGSNFTQSTFSPSTSPTTATQETGPSAVGYWKFDENQGQFINDSIQVDNTGQFGSTSTSDTNDPTWTSSDKCLSGSCLYFDGSDDYITYGSSINNTDLTGDFTVSAWIRVSEYSTDERNIFSSGDSGGNYWSIKIDTSGNFNFDEDGGGLDLSGTTVLNTNEWYFITLTKNGDSGDNISIYLNGELEGTGAASTVEQDGEKSIGQRLEGTGNDPFYGYIDEFKIYSYTRSTAEILTDYQQVSGANGTSVVLGAQDQSFLSDGLVAYWSMEDNVSGDGQTISDKSGSDNDGTTVDVDVSGMDCTVSGKFGLGCDFDGSDDWIQISATGNLILENYSAITAATWIKFDNLTSGDQQTFIANWDDDGSERPLRFQLDTDDKINCLMNNGGDDIDVKASNFTVSTDEWIHLVCTWDATAQKAHLYINGELYDTISDNDTSLYPVTDAPFAIGARSNGTVVEEFVDGQMDEVRVYNRALSSNGVKALYNWAPGPVGYWDFNENGGTTAYDKSGNENNGTFTGTPVWTNGKYGTGFTSTTGGGSPEDRVTVTDPVSGILDFDGSQSFTFGGWLKMSSKEAQAYPFMKRADNGIGVGYSLDFNDDPRCGYEDSGTTLDSATATGFNAFDDKWHYYTCVMDREGIITGSPGFHIYVDGILLNSDTTLSAGSSENSVQLEFGEDGQAREINGSYDEYRIYNYARTPSQIIQDMNGGHPIGGSPVGSQVAYWKFDEGYGDTAYDSSPQGNNGDLGTSGTTCPTAADSTCPSWTPNGKFGGAVDLENDGTNDYIEVSNFDYDVLQQGSEDASWSITTWVYPENDDYYLIAGRQGYDGGLGVDASGGGDKFQFDICDDLNNCTDIQTPDLNADFNSRWHYLAAVYDNRTMYFYHDAVLMGSANFSGTMRAYGTDFKIGKGAGAGMDGLVDEVKVYTTALTAEQVALDMNKGASVSYSVLGDSEKADLIDGEGSDPVLYINFDENTQGSTVYDKSGNGNSGNLVASMTGLNWVPSKDGLGITMEFDGSNDYVTVADSDALDLNDFSVMAWIYRFSSDTYAKVLDKDCCNNQGNYQLHLGFAGSNTDLNGGFHTGVGAVNCRGSSVPLNEWVHIANVFEDSADEIRLYINGRLDETCSTTSTPQNNTQPVTIGATKDGNARHFEGYIDEVKIYDYALTDSQMAYEYNRGAPVAHYKFDECQGTTAYDSSGNGNNGVIAAGAGSNTSVGTCSSGNGDEMWDNGTNGKFNSSLDFDGSEDYITIADPGTDSLFDFGDGDSISIAAWILPNSQNQYQSLFYKGDTSAAWNYDLSLRDANTTNMRMQFGYTQGNGASFHYGYGDWGSLTPNEWNHIAVVYTYGSANSLYMYVDGAQIDIQDPIEAFAPDEGNDDIRIGNYYANSDNFDGKIDDMRIYRYRLSENQIKKIMNEGASVRYGSSTGSP